MQNVPDAALNSISKPFAAAPAALAAVRRPEWVMIAFLIYAAAAAAILPVAEPVRNLVLTINAGMILTYGLLIYGDSVKWTPVISFVRDWLPLGLLVLAYREMGWFAVPHLNHALEARWVIWDRAILRGGFAAAVEAFGAVIPSLLEIAYSLVYVLAPFSVAMLYVHRRRDRVDRFLFIFTVGVLLCYAQFPLWPSEPPRVVFFGEDMPAYDTIFRHFNYWMLGNYGIHTSVFPSAHVAGAFSAAFGMRQALPERRWVCRVLLAIATLIALATFYGRYHYAVDAAAGFAVAVFAVALDAVLRGEGLSPAAARLGRKPSAGAEISVAGLPEFR